MSLISERYAAALFAIGEDKKKIDALSEDLSFLSEIWNSQPDLKGYLRNPRKSRETGQRIPLIPGSWKAGPVRAMRKWRSKILKDNLQTAAGLPKRIIP